MEELYIFGTGNAQTTHYYNTCFAVKDGDEYFMVGAGGGNGALHILGDIDMGLCHVHSIFVVHRHIDHVLGIIWMTCMVAAAMRRGKCKGELQICYHQGLMDAISTICRLTIQGKFYKMIGSHILLVLVEDGETVHTPDHDATFFDILSTRARQFRFTTIPKNGRRFTCADSEPYNTECRPYVGDSDWLLHETFCLCRDHEIFEPYGKHHSTVKEACELTKDLSIPNLVLRHTRDKRLTERKALYTAEGREYYHGSLLVPDDGEILPL